MSTESLPEPVVVAIAVALYGYNVSAVERAQAIYEHFEGACMEPRDLVSVMERYGSVATSLPFPSAEVYLRHALERYGEEAQRRVEIDRGSQHV